MQTIIDRILMTVDDQKKARPGKGAGFWVTLERLTSEVRLNALEQGAQLGTQSLQ